MIMTLGAKNGDTVEVESDDQAALDTIAGLVEQDLDVDLTRRHRPASGASSLPAPVVASCSAR